MPIALFFVGVVFITAGIRGTDEDLINLVKGDFENKDGQRGFISWITAILIIGALGYIEPIKPISRAFLVLVVIVLFLTRGGFFDKFIKGIQPLNEPTTGAPNQPAKLPNLPAVGINS